MSEVVNQVASTEAQAESVATTTQEQPVVNTADIISSLSEELKSVKSLEKFKGKDVNELAKSYLNLEKLVGTKQPTAPEKYVLPEEAGSLVNDRILEIAKKVNVTQEQLKGIVDGLIENNRSTAKAQEDAITAELAKRQAELSKEFGTALDSRLDSVKKILSQYGSDELKESLKESGALHDVNFIKFLDKITQDVLQVKMVGTDYQQQVTLTPDEAKREMTQKLGDSEFRAAYYSAMHPAHKAAVEEMTRLRSLSRS